MHGGDSQPEVRPRSTAPCRARSSSINWAATPRPGVEVPELVTVNTRSSRPPHKPTAELRTATNRRECERRMRGFRDPRRTNLSMPTDSLIRTRSSEGSICFRLTAINRQLYNVSQLNLRYILGIVKYFYGNQRSWHALMRGFDILYIYILVHKVCKILALASAWFCRVKAGEVVFEADKYALAGR
jgi:hypothetical protein